MSILPCACSIQRLAINSVGDALASSASVFETDDDPVLIAEALPFSLKLVESLLSEQPDHRGLLLTATRGYLLYSYAFVDMPAEESSLEDIDRTRELRRRARNLYLRAYAYASRLLELDYPGLTDELAGDPAEAVAAVGRDRDVAMLYWNAAALGLAISASRNEPALLARLPEVEAMLNRALTLDEAWNRGALHEFAISLAGAGTAAVDESAMQRHYQRALELSAGNRASLHVTYAEVVTVRKQDREQFAALLRRALAVDLNEDPDQRLLNVIAQQRARWLLENADEFFL
ncbi:MAG TPA: TRAP transporter TatT component family protein [Gammaproteobacteria bacterium]